MASSSTQDEEVRHRKEEEDALHDEDLNKETKHEDDDKKIVASESETSEAEKKIMEQEVKDDDDKKIVASESSSATSEQEVKDDTNQEDESRGKMMTVPSTTTTPPRSLTREEEEAREKDDHLSAMLWSLSNDAVPPKNPSVLEIDDHDEDDSEQTLRFLTRWKAPKTPPEKIVHGILVEQCSRPIQKQLTTSDVNFSKLALPRKRFQQLLDETEATRGRKVIRFQVYGPDGKVREMWLGGDEERSSFELVIGWRKFVVDYGFKECCDFITVWMFRHRDTQCICLAVDAMRFSFRKEVSKRISVAAFEDSD